MASEEPFSESDLTDDGTGSKVVAVIVSLFVAVAFLHMNLYGRFTGTQGGCLELIDPGGSIPGANHFFHGWPLVFGEHAEKCLDGTWDVSNPFVWQSFRIGDARSLVIDLFCCSALIVAAGMASNRLLRRPWTNLQFSTADLLALTTVACILAGFFCMEQQIGNSSGDMGKYASLWSWPQSEQIVVVLTLAGLNLLLVKTVTGWLAAAPIRDCEGEE